MKKNTHYINSAVIISVAMAVLPFSMFFMQTYLLPAAGNYFLGDAVAKAGADGELNAKGSEISINDENKIKGDINKAELVLVEFSDYECYFCNKFHPTIKSVFDKSNGKLAWVYKHFPLEQIHPNAKPAAIASECVAKLGGKDKFWNYTDTLIANNKNFSTQYFESEATKLGINLSAYKTCIIDPAISTKVEADQAEGSALGVNGTPNTMIAKKEGDKYTVLESINGALDEKAVQAIINKYIK
jgi:protein-disulfide isomerase